MTEVNEAALDAIEADLRDAVGKENAVTSGELASRHVPDDGEANPTTREAIKILMRERGLPVIGGSQGYYVPTDQGPIDDAIESLEGRIDGIRERQRLLAENWAAWTWSDPEAEADAAMPESVRAQVEADPFLSVDDVLEYYLEGPA